jgi:hypothetical protein
LVKDLSGLRKGTIVIASVRNSATEKLSGAAREAFQKLGSHEVVSLQANEGWAFIGIKGQ